MQARCKDSLAGFLQFRSIFLGKGWEIVRTIEQLRFKMNIY